MSKFTLVQFCPCGHAYNIRMDDPRILRQLADPDKMDAPILPSRECEECLEDLRIKDRCMREFNLDLAWDDLATSRPVEW